MSSEEQSFKKTINSKHKEFPNTESLNSFNADLMDWDYILFQRELKP